jgi:transcriptional regulator GlxA family with amidase domain
VVSKRQFRAAVRLLDILAGHLAEQASRSLVAANGDEPPQVTQAKEFLHAHAGERLRLRQVAEHVHLSAPHFCKMFKRATGMTLTEFVARVRVEKAKSLLGDLRMRMTEVASLAGFSSISQFNRTFRRYAGTSPTHTRLLRVQSERFRLVKHANLSR